MDEMEKVINEEEFEEAVLNIRRVAKVVKGGKRLGFRAVVAVGNKKGKVGVGVGNANEVPTAIRKGAMNARKAMIDVILNPRGTIPHEVVGRSDAGVVIMKPAAPGTGLIASSTVMSILELAGVKDILAKSIRSNNPLTVAYAVMEGLKQLRSPVDIARYRGMNVKEVFEGKKVEA